MAYRYKWVKSKKYYKYGVFDNWEEALKIAKYMRKKNKSRYFIEKQRGILGTQYCLYLDRYIRI